MKKIATLLLLFLVTPVSTAGCIDIYFVRDLLVPSEEDEINFGITEYNFNHNFTSVPPENILEVYNEEFIVPVKPLAKHMRFDIGVVMTSAEEVWEPLKEYLNDTPFGPYIEELIKMAAQRYVEVTIKSPDGDEWFNYKFNDTETVEFPPETPLFLPGDGDWVIEVEGTGAGYRINDDLAYFDTFSAKVVVNEPIE
ncbi:MAG: hypothetical protein JSV09_09495 [Thermoplasmata archaeon]|nr:MAG: hypothetical protein JSV09_09495 [Thermoplasmata archaeon]